jgi:hypothetical protein
LYLTLRFHDEDGACFRKSGGREIAIQLLVRNYLYSVVRWYRRDERHDDCPTHNIVLEERSLCDGPREVSIHVHLNLSPKFLGRHVSWHRVDANNCEAVLGGRGRHEMWGREDAWEKVYTKLGAGPGHVVNIW